MIECQMRTGLAVIIGSVYFEIVGLFNLSKLLWQRFEVNHSLNLKYPRSLSSSFAILLYNWHVLLLSA